MNRVVDVIRLLDSGMSILATDEHQNTVAHIAAEAGNLEILRLLADRGASLDRRNWINQTPLSLAAWHGHLQVVQYLCEHSATTHGSDLNTAPLGAAAAAGHLEIVRYLVEQRDVPLNALERPFGATPLFVAARFLRLDVVQYLMEKGADPTIATTHGETAISCVTQRLLGQPHAPTPDEAKRCHDLLACLGGEGVKSTRGSPPNRAVRGTPGLLSHLIKPRKEFHFWQ
jgi:ankyrin repeat protein